MSSESLNSPRFSLLDHLLGGTVDGASSPITGPFGLLPAELLEVVACHLLRIDASAHGALLHELARTAARSFGRLLQAAKGFGVLPAMLRVEAAAHGRCSAPNLSEPCAHPFFAQVLKEVESIFVARAFVLAHQIALLHSNHTRTGLAYRQQNTKWQDMGFDFVSGVRRMATGERYMRADPAWTFCGELLCATDAGAVVATKDRVVALEGTPAKALDPDTALHIAWQAPRNEVRKATSRGTLLALGVQNNEALAHPSVVSYTITTWDMERNVVVDTRNEEGWLEELWISPAGVLHRLATLLREEWVDPGRIVLRRSRRWGHCVVQTDMGLYNTPSSMAFCADTGDIAFLRAERCAWSLGQWRQDLVTVRYPDAVQPNHPPFLGAGVQSEVDHFETDRPTSDSVALAPRGDVMVVTGRGHLEPRFKFYEKNENGWGLRAEVTLAAAYGTSGHWVNNGEMNGVFSPCGSLFVGMVRSVHTGVMIVNLRETLATGNVLARFWRAASTTVPRTVCWRNGLWAETAEHGGVVRLGFAAPLQA